MSERDDARPVRSSAEWVTFTISAAVLALVVVLIGANVGRDDEPPRPVVEVRTDQVDERDGVFVVPVDVHNAGGRAAANVQVLAELVTADGTLESDQSVDFLGVDEEVRLVFVFATDPAEGELTVTVGGFAVP